ncbi:hypothetical protein FH608_028245 [Nonomuraea phyllanthi]|uniref:Uncharacterized protein n=1 Tax=Nonomuraea phyllanthi TaxID=2219224 RepID=A0A5C4W4Q5_9ACTN|nr:hypothetical protein [Nonomuraea phyllanthi]KAB8191848.1 hypothetical protein FH608_028245 [Nonomuraea phyllanthi]
MDLGCPEAPLGFEEGFVAECGVFGADVGIAGGQQVLAVQSFFGLDLGPVDRQPSVRSSSVSISAIACSRCCRSRCS